MKILLAYIQHTDTRPLFFLTSTYFIAASFHETDEEEEESPYKSDMDEEDEKFLNDVS